MLEQRRHRRGLAEEIAVQAGDRLDQFVARIRGVGAY
jgi:hypothetical protein